jgi:hypothetical protein
MKKTKPVLFTIFSLFLILMTSGCNLPFISPPATPTPTFTDTPTQVPPTEIPTMAPTFTPTTIPPTATATIPPAPPPTVIPTATKPPTKAPTKEPVVPFSKTKYEGSFPGGTFLIRTGPNGASVVPKSLVLKKAACKEGGKISESMDFEPPTFFWITDGKFAIYWGNEVTITGVFISPTRATGSLKVELTSPKKCTIGPVTWTADWVQ